MEIELKELKEGRRSSEEKNKINKMAASLPQFLASPRMPIILSRLFQAQCLVR
jgi:hypothetical protein